MVKPSLSGIGGHAAMVGMDSKLSTYSRMTDEVFVAVVERCGRTPRSPARPSESSWHARPLGSVTVMFGHTIVSIVTVGPHGFEARKAPDTGRL